MFCFDHSFMIFMLQKYFFVCCSLNEKWVNIFLLAKLLFIYFFIHSCFMIVELKMNWRCCCYNITQYIMLDYLCNEIFCGIKCLSVEFSSSMFWHCCAVFLNKIVKSHFSVKFCECEILGPSKQLCRISHQVCEIAFQKWRKII